MKQWAIGLMSNEEKSNILDKHRSLYDGYRTMQPKIKSEQPLYVQDFANDKGGVTLSNKNVVTSYKNVGINEQVESKDMCEQCGGRMTEGICEQCGSNYEMEEEMQQVKDLKNVEDLNLSDKFDYVEGEVEETEQGDPYGELESAYTFKSKGPKDGGDAYSEKAYDMDLDDEDVKPAFDFESDGIEPVYETMESAFSDYEKKDEEIEEGYQETDEQYPRKHVWNKMRRKNRADAEGEEFDDSELDMSDYEEFEPNTSSWEDITTMTGDDEFSHLDEDLKESVVQQKNRIVEMMDRMKKF
jgi:hypothetical protein